MMPHLYSRQTVSSYKKTSTGTDAGLAERSVNVLYNKIKTCVNFIFELAAYIINYLIIYIYIFILI